MPIRFLWHAGGACTGPVACSFHVELIGLARACPGLVKLTGIGETLAACRAGYASAAMAVEIRCKPPCFGAWVGRIARATRVGAA